MLNVHSVVAFLLVHKYLVSGKTSDDDPCKPTSKNRIVGGSATSIYRHPWQISFQMNKMHMCGGVIISPDIVLTAAHCVDKSEDINNYTVGAGGRDLRKLKRSMPIRSAMVHNQYDDETDDYDIAILKLKEAFNFSRAIKAVKLPDPSFNISVGTAVIASGWGLIREEDYDASPILREVQLRYIDETSCKEALADYGIVTERMICAGNLNVEKDTCQGDSGGPLQKNGILIGLTSWGEGCATKLPGVYTNIRYLRSWIKDNTGL